MAGGEKTWQKKKKITHIFNRMKEIYFQKKNESATYYL